MSAHPLLYGQRATHWRRPVPVIEASGQGEASATGGFALPDKLTAFLGKLEPRLYLFYGGRASGKSLALYSLLRAALEEPTRRPCFYDLEGVLGSLEQSYIDPRRVTRFYDGAMIRTLSELKISEQGCVGSSFGPLLVDGFERLGMGPADQAMVGVTFDTWAKRRRRPCFVAVQEQTAITGKLGIPEPLMTSATAAVRCSRNGQNFSFMFEKHPDPLRVGQRLDWDEPAW